jgi:curved DNA-binding protein CbpA
MPIDDEAGRQAIRSWIEQQHAELDQKSYYQLLGVERTASENEVRTAYYHMVARFHPDLYGDILEADVRARLVTLYSRLVEGYRVLRDPGKRQQYGKMLEIGKLRWTLEEERGPRKDNEGDIANPNARRFYKLAKAALIGGDAKSAVVNLKLALSCEPDNAAIQVELARAEALAKGKS